MFVDGEDQYLYVRTLGIGMEASAQLVIHVQTGDLVMRKVNKHLIEELETESDDPERVLFLIQSQARLHGVQPNIALLYSADDVPSPHVSDNSKLLYHRVKYFRYYNGGNLGDFSSACLTRGTAPPPSLICKMIRDLVEALRFMYSMQPYYVVHGDLHADNVFLNFNMPDGPSFFLGDFGWSTCGRLRAGNNFGAVVDIRQVWQHTQELMEIQSDYDSQHTLREYLEASIEPELRRLAHGPPSSLPKLERLLELLSAAPPTTPPDMRPFLPCEDQSTPLPRLYDAWEEAENARYIDGPWHVAQVSIDQSTGKLTVIRTSELSYHRPASSSYDTDSEDEEPKSLSNGV